MIPLAHSSRGTTVPPDPYARHVRAVACGARDRAVEMLRFALEPAPEMLDAIYQAGIFHDLGKLDQECQSALRQVKHTRLPWDHIDAGVAHLTQRRNWLAAWLVRAHHAPGLPRREEHFSLGRELRGLRHDEKPSHEHERLISRTNSQIGDYLATHHAAVGECQVTKQPELHGLTLRMALSCLVDADHADTAFFDSGQLRSEPLPCRWQERLSALECYLEKLDQGSRVELRERNARRRAFFNACRESPLREAMVACEGPVGIGKTTAVTAYLLQRAVRQDLRRIVIVAPYTNILSQSAKILRQALTLPGENADHVVMEHHHRADFGSRSDRDLAVLWQAPIVVTTSVSFFETLAANDPATLRKLHGLPGSAVFIDEAHAALPARLWPQNWLWVRELCERWGCCMVFASGSLARFWEDKNIVEKPQKLPELMPAEQAREVLDAERRRVRYARLVIGMAVTIGQLIEHVQGTCGPRLVILNTVQNAALVAKRMRDSGCDVLHLSTALTPRDRDRILRRVTDRLKKDVSNWSLVATSCVEAGVDISFRCAFRERFSVASLIQTGGRVNRNAEFDAKGGGTVYDFSLSDNGITQHPDPSLKVSAELLREFIAEDELNWRDPADLVTEAMGEEICRCGGLGHDALLKAERERDYPKVKQWGAVITADTRLVVVSGKLQRRLEARQCVSSRQLLRGSVQLWSTKIKQLGMEPIEGRREIYFWKDEYDSKFLGYMAGVLKHQDFLTGNLVVV